MKWVEQLGVQETTWFKLQPWSDNTWIVLARPFEAAACMGKADSQVLVVGQLPLLSM